VDATTRKNLLGGLDELFEELVRLPDLDAPLAQAQIMGVFQKVVVVGSKVEKDGL
jgi:hypothetical protein